MTSHEPIIQADEMLELRNSGARECMDSIQMRTKTILNLVRKMKACCTWPETALSNWTTKNIKTEVHLISPPPYWARAGTFYHRKDRFKLEGAIFRLT